jgi:hypothetical protein
MSQVHSKRFHVLEQQPSTTSKKRRCQHVKMVIARIFSKHREYMRRTSLRRVVADDEDTDCNFRY